MLVTGLWSDVVANDDDDGDNSNSNGNSNSNTIAIVYATRLSFKSHSVQVFHRVIYCIISELHNENTESDWVIRETGDMWWQCISHASTLYMDYTESFVIPSLHFYLKQQRQIQHRQTDILVESFSFIKWWFVRYDQKIYS